MAFTDIPIALRWSDQDANGHLNNARIVTLMEESRVRWMRGLEGLAAFRGLGGAVVASLTVDYMAQGEYVPEMVVRLGIERVGSKSFTIRHIGLQGGKTVFDGSTVIVPLADDRTTSRSLTGDERASLAEHEVPARRRRS